MGAFDDISLGWGNRDYLIPANRVLGCIARIEDVVTLFDLVRYSEGNTIPMAKVAQAYGAALRYAGAQVSDDEVYEGMFADMEQSVAVMQAVQGLLGMMVPKSALEDGSPAMEKPRRKKRQARSSRKSGSRSSAVAG